jgi:hypothetical protein
MRETAHFARRKHSTRPKSRGLIATRRRLRTLKTHWLVQVIERIQPPLAIVSTTAARATVVPIQFAGKITAAYGTQFGHHACASEFNQWLAASTPTVAKSTPNFRQHDTLRLGFKPS